MFVGTFGSTSLRRLHNGSRAAPELPALTLSTSQTIVGSAGSIRLRGAILQIVVNVVHHGLSVEEAIQAPRIHFEDGRVHCEGGADPAELDRIPRDFRAHEPEAAVHGGADGLDPLRAVLAGMDAWMAPGGAFVTLVAEEQVETARGLGRRVVVRPTEDDDAVLVFGV